MSQPNLDLFASTTRLTAEGRDQAANLTIAQLLGDQAKQEVDREIGPYLAFHAAVFDALNLYD